jgi:predicted amidohydrolase
MQLGFLQYAPQDLSAEGNIEFIIKTTSNTKSALIVLPELFLGSYTNISVIEQSTLPQFLAPLIKHSSNLNLAFVGSLPLQIGGQVFNRTIFINKGQIIAHYDKRHLFGAEQQVFVPGDSPYQVFEYSYLKFSVQICFDNINPVAASDAARSHGIDLLIAPASVSVNFIRAILKARSLENQIITIFCNRIGVDDGVYFSGGSSIFFPDGRQIVTGTSTALKVASLSEQKLLHFFSTRQSFFESTVTPSVSDLPKNIIRGHIGDRRSRSKLSDSPERQAHFNW